MQNALGRIRIFVLLLVAYHIAPVGAFAADVVLYSSKPQAVLQGIAHDFEKETGIRVHVTRLGTVEAMKRIQAEKATPKADLFWGGDLGVIDKYKTLFQPYISPELSAITTKYREQNNLWTASNIQLMLLMANTQLIPAEELPKTWEALLDPKWKGKIVMANPEKSGSASAQLYGLYTVFGAEGLKKLVGNTTFLENSSQVYKSVAHGAYGLGLTMEYAAYAYLAKGAKCVSIIYPKEGVFVAPEAMALVSGCKHPAEAKRLFNYLLSKKFETAAFVHQFRRPSRTDIPDIPGIPALRSLVVFEKFDPIEAGRKQQELIDIVKNAKQIQ